MKEPVFATCVQDSPISRELFYAIRLLVPKGGKILELGSGQGSTPALAQFYDLRSVEHKQNFLGYYNAPENYIYAELGPGSFYSKEVLAKIDFPYELLLVDGPDEENRQEAFLENMEYFNKAVPWVFDDYGYKKSWSDGMHLIAEKSGKEIMPFAYCGKPFCVMI